jgi:ATP-dependent RNA helicase DeaD
MTAELQSDNITTSFNNLGLPDTLLAAVQKLGYNEPTPIQAQAIPALLSGADVLGQAQTGTGKTAAFALPLLAQVNLKSREPQILVLVPTRELALQVAEAFNGFAANMAGINILAIYGGQGYNEQLSMLRKGTHIIIGTPGRVMDHMRRETLKLGSLKTLILDEADEMLRMGFAEDVEWILQQVPEQRQIGLFSATMPPAIKNIAETYLHNPQRITVKNKTSTAATIKQYFWPVANLNKLDALARIIESEDGDAMIVFVKTKRATEEVAEQLTNRGFNAVAINGDIVQKQRERVIEQLKSGRIKILIATDVAARGIDVDRITHVINYDAPNNSESYVHRIGRTGRAGRAGTAIIFISPRERYILRNIERATRQPIEELETPSIKKVNERRVAGFKQRITDALTQDVGYYESLISQYIDETEVSPLKVAAALAKLVQGNTELLLQKERISTSAPREYRERSDRSSDRGDRRDRSSDRGDRTRAPRNRELSLDRFTREESPRRRDSGRGEGSGSREPGMEQYRIEIGRDDGLLPKNLVGAIANTAGIEGRSIGKIKIESKFSLVDLPKDMPKNILQTLQRLKLSGKQMNLRKVN